MNKPVKYSLAKLLKEKGFNQDDCKDYWEEGLNSDTPDKIELNGYGEASTNFWAAPTIADVVMWLLEKHRIWIAVSFNKEEGTFQWKINGELGRFKEITPVRAYETAIEHVLNELI